MTFCPPLTAPIHSDHGPSPCQVSPPGSTRPAKRPRTPPATLRHPTALPLIHGSVSGLWLKVPPSALCRLNVRAQHGPPPSPKDQRGSAFEYHLPVRVAGDGANGFRTEEGPSYLPDKGFLMGISGATGQSRIMPSHCAILIRKHPLWRVFPSWQNETHSSRPQAFTGNIPWKG
jgi:hypothetical protein